MILYFLVDFGFFDSCIAVKMFHPSKLGLFKFGLMGNRNKFWLNRKTGTDYKGLLHVVWGLIVSLSLGFHDHFSF